MMANWSRAGHETYDLHGQLDSIRGHLRELSHAFSGASHRQLGRARDLAAETVHEAEETMKDHLAASMLIALGVGVLVGYFIRRETE
jgi:hypothetical protein